MKAEHDVIQNETRQSGKTRDPWTAPPELSKDTQKESWRLKTTVPSMHCGNAAEKDNILR